MATENEQIPLLRDANLPWFGGGSFDSQPFLRGTSPGSAELRALHDRLLKCLDGHSILEDVLPGKGQKHESPLESSWLCGWHDPDFS